MENLQHLTAIHPFVSLPFEKSELSDSLAVRPNSILNYHFLIYFIDFQKLQLPRIIVFAPRNP